METDIIQSSQIAESSEQEYSSAKYKQAWLHAWQQSAYAEKDTADIAKAEPEQSVNSLRVELKALNVESDLAASIQEQYQVLDQWQSQQSGLLSNVNLFKQLTQYYGKAELRNQLENIQVRNPELVVNAESKKQFQPNQKILFQVKGKLPSQRFSDVNAVVYSKGQEVKLFIRDYKRQSGRYLEEYLRAVRQELNNLGMTLKSVVINGKSYTDISSAVKGFLSQHEK